MPGDTTTTRSLALKTKHKTNSVALVRERTIPSHPSRNNSALEGHGPSVFNLQSAEFVCVCVCLFVCLFIYLLSYHS
jgi:hypothetical protein